MTARVITFREYWGVEIGETIDSRQRNFQMCPAVTSLRAVLRSDPWLRPMVQGEGPTVRGRQGHERFEFNRHHGGLAVDIMLHANNQEQNAVAQALVHLFRRHVATMKWRSIIYNNVTVGRSSASNGGGHTDHIHIDWHDHRTVQFREDVQTIPVRLRGAVEQLPLVTPGRLATQMSWVDDAQTGDSSGIAAEFAQIMSNRTALTASSTWDATVFGGPPPPPPAQRRPAAAAPPPRSGGGREQPLLHAR